MQATIRQMQTARIRPLSAFRQPKLCVPASDGLHIIPAESIVRCVADSNYCSILTMSGKEIFVAKTIKFIEEQLPGSMFVRVHQSHLVRVSQIRFIGTDHVRLADESEVPVSRRKRQDVIDLFRGSV